MINQNNELFRTPTSTFPRLTRSSCSSLSVSDLLRILTPGKGADSCSGKDPAAQAFQQVMQQLGGAS
jgi:hypothetical protein